MWQRKLSVLVDVVPTFVEDGGVHGRIVWDVMLENNGTIILAFFAMVSCRVMRGFSVLGS